MGRATGWEPGRIGGGRGTGGRRERNVGGRVLRGWEAGEKVYMVYDQTNNRKKLPVKFPFLVLML